MAQRHPVPIPPATSTSLAEVDGWCGFTGNLAPLGGYAPRTEHHYAALLASLVAHGTNLGIVTMAQSTKKLSVDVLQHVSRWCLRGETLKAANAALVDYHHRLELAGVWGNGGASSSDGQRFGVQESSLSAGFYPRARWARSVSRAGRTDGHRTV